MPGKKHGLARMHCWDGLRWHGESLHQRPGKSRGRGEPGISRRTLSVVWREAREGQMAAPPRSPRLVGTRPGAQRPLLTEGEPARWRQRGSSHSLSDPNPSLRALVQELEVLVPNPAPLAGSGPTSTECPRVQVPDAQDEAGVGCPCSPRTSVRGSQRGPPASGPAPEQQQGAGRGLGEKPRMVQQAREGPCSMMRGPGLFL